MFHQCLLHCSLFKSTSEKFYAGVRKWFKLPLRIYYVCNCLPIYFLKSVCLSYGNLPPTTKHIVVCVCVCMRAHTHTHSIWNFYGAQYAYIIFVKVT